MSEVTRSLCRLHRGLRVADSAGPSLLHSRILHIIITEPACRPGHVFGFPNLPGEPQVISDSVRGFAVAVGPSVDKDFGYSNPGLLVQQGSATDTIPGMADDGLGRCDAVTFRLCLFVNCGPGLLQIGGFLQNGTAYVPEEFSSLSISSLSPGSL